jgi:hypothetical protein
MKTEWRRFLHWPLGRTQVSLHRTEALTIAATKVVARRLWNYSVPKREHERLGKMRNLQETVAALKYRRRLGEASATALSSLSATDDAVEELLTRLITAGRGEAQFAKKVLLLRLDHRTHVEATFSDDLVRWRLLSRLNEVYVKYGSNPRRIV